MGVTISWGTFTFCKSSNLFGLQCSWHHESTWPGKWNLSTTKFLSASVAVVVVSLHLMGLQAYLFRWQASSYTMYSIREEYIDECVSHARGVVYIAGAAYIYTLLRSLLIADTINCEFCEWSQSRSSYYVPANNNVLMSVTWWMHILNNLMVVFFIPQLLVPAKCEGCI